MTGDPGNLSVGAQRTRRNLVKMGALVAAAAVAKAKSAAAAPCAVCRISCFVRGTRIQTADGERKVEALTIGDMLPTMFGGSQPIQWIGRYPFKKSDLSKPWPREARPVRIARSALAPGVPKADLYVSGEHALFIDGLLVPARCLVNGATITCDDARERDELEFFHVKLERHDVILAEGAPVDTLLHVDESAVNFAEYFRRYGAPTAEEASCVPRVSYRGGRGELKSRIRSALSPWIDRREQIDVIRDRLEERGLGLSRQSEFIR